MVLDTWQPNLNVPVQTAEEKVQGEEFHKKLIWEYCHMQEFLRDKKKGRIICTICVKVGR